MAFLNPSSMMIDADHQIISTLGIGGAGEVYSIRNINDNTIFAAKYARKDLKVSQQKKLALSEREMGAMECLRDHPNILKSIKLVQKRKSPTQPKGFSLENQKFDARLTTEPYHMIEYCENGSFISYMKNQEVLCEQIVSLYIEQLLGCMEYIHYQGYAHLDIKLDNILLDDYFNIRLSDFGSAVKLDDQPYTTFRRGTPRYMAPEVLNLQDGESFDAYKADVYSMGICFYLMLFKRFPVHLGDQYPSTNELLEDTEICKRCPFDCDETRWSEVSPEIQRILIACLNKDPVDRPSTSELISHFALPPISENIEDLLFEEMQQRRAKYEQDKHEQQNEEKVLISVDKADIVESSEDKSHESSHSQENLAKTAKSTNNTCTSPN